MANLIACGDCTLYHAIIKPHRNGKGSTDTHKGHCLDQTVYAKNKAGNPVYPPNAKVEDLPYNRHKVVLRRDTDVVPHCLAVKKRKG